MSRVRRVVNSRLRALLVLGAGLFLGVLAVLAGSMFHAAAAASTDPTCTSGTDTLDITLEGASVTVKEASGGFTVTPSTGTGCNGNFTLDGFGTITFHTDDTNAAGTPTSVVLDQTGNGGEFPCGLTVTGAIGDATVGNGTLAVNGKDGESITAGTSGVWLGQPSCTTPTVSVTGVGGYQLSDVTISGASTPATLSAAGTTDGTGNAISVPVTFSGGTSTHHLDSSTFQVGSGIDQINEFGSSNTLDLSAVKTSPGTNLAVNASGTSQTVGGTTVQDGEAAVGSIITDSFGSSAPFTSIIGSSSGNTDFLGGDAGGVTFTGNGTSNAADFTSATVGVTVNLSASTQNGVLANNVSVKNGAYALKDITTATGSGQGQNIFYAGGGSDSFTFTGNKNTNFFYGGNSTGTDTFNSNGTKNHFVLSTSDTTIVDATSGNTVDLSSPNVGVPTISFPAVIDVSGAADGTTTNDTATTQNSGVLVSTYNFSQLAEPTVFVGAQQGTKFDPGTAADSFLGIANPSAIAANELDYRLTSSTGPLVVCVPGSGASCSTAASQSELNGVPQPFSNIVIYDGLSTGNTTFGAGAQGGFEFRASQSGNALDFSGAGSDPVNVDLNNSPNLATIGGTCSTACNDVFANISTVTGASQGGNTFVAGSAGNETFAQKFGGTNDTIDFKNLQTGNTTPLVVNTSGGPIGTQADFSALLGATTYSFSSGSAAFTSFTGSGAGNTNFVSSGSGGYNFTALGTNNSIDFSQATPAAPPISADLLTPTNSVSFSPGTCANPPAPAASCDTISGLSTVIASGGGNTFTAGSGAANFTGNGNSNVFIGGAGTDTFTSNGTSNRFEAGTGDAKFVDPSSGNTVDLSSASISTPAVVNVSGVTVGPTPGITSVSTANNTAMSNGGSTTYDFTGLGSPVTFQGALQGTTFDAGAAADTFHGQNQPTDTLNYDFAPGGPLAICLAASGSACAGNAGKAVLSSVPEVFTNIKTFDGLATGNTTFGAALPNGSTFNATGSGNSADFSNATSPITADLFHNPNLISVGGVCPCDTISGLTSIIGASGGSNVFIAGSGSETFGQSGGGSGDKIDFSNLPTNPSSALTVNTSGGAVGTQADFSATLGVATYSFTNGASAFTHFLGPLGGNTSFDAGPTGNYFFNASSSNDMIDFSHASPSIASPLTVDLTATPSAGSVSGLSGGSDTISGLTNVTLAGNSNTFRAGPGPAAYQFSDNGNNNIFVGGGTSPLDGGVDTFTSTGTGNSFVVGLDSATINDPASQNIVDLSASVATPAVVNVSGQQVGGTATGTATTSAGSKYTFTSLAAPTTFKGGQDGTIFYAGAAQDIFEGSGLQPNTLSYADTVGAAGALSVCVAQTVLTTPACQSPTTPGTAVLGTVRQTFSDIQDYVGLSLGATTFATGQTRSDSFTGTGVGNAIDYSTDGHAITANLFAVPATVTDAGSGDSISGITSVIGSSTGSNDFIAGLGSETFSDPAAAGGDTADFSNIPTSQTNSLTVNVSGHPVSGAADSSAVVPGSTYNFTAPTAGPPVHADFVHFVGAATGSTRFDASGSIGGYTFTGSCAITPAPIICPSWSPSNTADFSSVLGAGATPAAPLTINMGSGQVSALSYSSPDFLEGAFINQGTNTVIGSGATGANNVFDGNLLGTTFQAGGVATNTISYVGETSGSGVDLNLSSDLASGSGITDSWSFGTGPLTVQGSPHSDVFTLGSSPICPTGGAGACPTLESGGGGAVNPDTLDLSEMPVAVTADLNTGTVKRTGSSVTYAEFTTGCVAVAPSSGDPLCLGTIDNASAFADSFVANPQSLSGSLPHLTINGGGTDSLSLAPVTTVATICMPIAGTSPLGAGAPCPTALHPNGTVAAGLPPTPLTPSIDFSGIVSVTGTTVSEPSPPTLPGDYFYAGTGTETLVDGTQANGTIDFSNLPGTKQQTSPGAPGVPGVTVNVSNVAGTQQGTVTTPPQLDDSATISGFGTFIGSGGDDSFKQSGPGTYSFYGGDGFNSLDLSGAPVPVPPAMTTFTTQAPATGECDTAAGFTNTDGSAVLASQLKDQFFCMSSLTAPPSANNQVQGSSSNASPGQTATINGGGTGTLSLTNDIFGGGVTVNLTTGWVTGDGFNFQFTGFTTVNGTPWNDTFIPGTSNVTINGGGGLDGLSYQGGTGPGSAPTYPGASSPVTVNLSPSAYTVPTGLPNAGTIVPRCTAIGGYGGTVTMPGCTIANVTGTGSAGLPDTLVGGAGTGTLTGGTGADRFVLTNGGTTTIVGGSGASTLDLSQLAGINSFSLLQDQVVEPLAFGSVDLWSGNVETVIASPGGGTLTGGTENGLTLIGGPGNDTLNAGTGTQTLIGGGGTDTFTGGSGSDTMIGGSSPVTFEPGQGPDTLTSPTTGNTLSYAGDPVAVNVDLNAGNYTVPVGKPGQGTVLDGLTATGGFSGGTANLSGAGITHVMGTSGNDIIVTGAGNDVIDGAGGSDLIAIETGGNTLTEPSGSSPTFLFEGGGSSNIINGGGGGTVDFSEAPAAVNVNLQSGQSTGGFGGTQTLSGIKSVIGTQTFNDVLIAGAPGALLQDGLGRDLLVAGPTGGDTLQGGGQGSTFCSQSSCADGASSGGGSSTAPNVMKGGSSDQSFFTVNGGDDVITGGGGSGNFAEIDKSGDTVTNPATFTNGIVVTP